MSGQEALVAELRGIVGEAAVLTAEADMAAFATDWRGAFRGRPACVVRPASTSEVSAVVKACRTRGAAIVPQGGNTGLAGGATPNSSGVQVLLSLGRMSAIREIDSVGMTVVAEAGAILQSVKEAVEDAGRMLPISLAAEGSATIGGVISTNAGGVDVLRYGMTRGLTLGLEIVLADGTIVDGLRKLRKDNAGQDWKQLFIGTEGSLGIVTAAVLRLVPRPRHSMTALIAVPGLDDALRLFDRAMTEIGDSLSAFELISADGFDLVRRHAGLEPPIAAGEWFLLIEAGSTLSGLRDAAESLLETAFAEGWAEDGVVAESGAQAKNLWALREHLTESEAREGPSVKHDVSVPLTAMPVFVDEVRAALTAVSDRLRLNIFGHLGDGNLHVNVLVGDGDDKQRINRTVHDVVVRHGGSISAEHGLGQYRLAEWQRLRPIEERRIAASVKAALDPQGLLNPGKAVAPVEASGRQGEVVVSDESFDYVIIGGGTAGCVLANRLSASGNHTVLLIEAGEAGRSPWIHIPAGFYKLLTNPRYNWRFETAPEAGTKNRVIAIPRGKGLGGSTLINGMIYVRGQRMDYDGWAQLGCPGWGFEDVLPIFRKLEDFAGPQDELRGHGGPLPVTEVNERPAISEAFIAAAEAAGHRRNPDYNGPEQDGFGYYQVNQRKGRRVSAAAAYLKPAMGRPNLSVVTGTHVTGIEIEDGRAVAVTARRAGIDVRYRARGEIVLAAGAVQSPHLLELSGIGDPALLSAAGIETRHALPGVGDNYLDHFCTRMSWRVSQPVTLNEATRGWRLALAVAQYAALRRGILTFGTGLAHGFVRSREGLEGPDVQYFFMHASYANAAERKLDKAPGMTLGVTQLRPQSRGTIHVAGPDPFRQPTIRPNFLAAAEDRRVMVEGMKIGRHIVEQAPLDGFRAFETSPGPACQSDEDWLAFARQNGQTIYHAGGTCRMGREGQSVVDPRLKVHGIGCLRVVDASIMPTIVSGNTQAAVFMIAEKGAEMILADARSAG